MAVLGIGGIQSRGTSQQIVRGQRIRGRGIAAHRLVRTASTLRSSACHGGGLQRGDVQAAQLAGEADGESSREKALDVVAEILSEFGRGQYALRAQRGTLPELQDAQIDISVSSLRVLGYN